MENNCFDLSTFTDEQLCAFARKMLTSPPSCFEALKAMIEDMRKASLEFHVDDVVYYYDSKMPSPGIEKCNITDVEIDNDVARYHLVTPVGRNCGWKIGREIFRTPEECAKKHQQIIVRSLERLSKQNQPKDNY